jgi:hypothetical protein
VYISYTVISIHHFLYVINIKLKLLDKKISSKFSNTKAACNKLKRKRHLSYCEILSLLSGVPEHSVLLGIYSRVDWNLPMFRKTLVPSCSELSPEYEESATIL